MTRFLCHELLFEFVTDQLDPIRKSAMEQHLKNHRDSKQELERLETAISYCQNLSGGEFDPIFAQKLKGLSVQGPSVLQKSAVEIKEWAWRATPYLILVSIFVLGGIVFKPWGRVFERGQTLVELEKRGSTPQIPEDVPVRIGFRQMDVLSVVNPLPAPIILSLYESTAVPTQIMDVAEARAEPRAVTTPGFLWRASMDIPNFSATWPLIRDKIQEMGGHAAGSVELGWLRRPDQSYFHFSMSEDQYESLREYLATFGPVRFNKQIHPRVMPEGQIRIILTVKDNGELNEPPGPANEEKTETP